MAQENNIVWTLNDDANLLMAYQEKESQKVYCEKPVQECIDQCKKVIINFAEAQKVPWQQAVEQITAHVYVLRVLLEHQAKTKIILIP